MKNITRKQEIKEQLQAAVRGNGYNEKQAFKGDKESVIPTCTHVEDNIKNAGNTNKVILSEEHKTFIDNEKELINTKG